MLKDFTIKTKEDAAEAVKRCGFLPLFRNSVPGFSIEEHVHPIAWFSSGVDGVWEWKGPLIRENAFAYGKLFEKKAAFVTREWYLDLANYRRDGYDFDALYDDEKASYAEKYLYDLVDANGPVLSKTLKVLGNYGREGIKGFDPLLTKLQAKCYVLTSDFVYETDKRGNTYGWGVGEYCTPEQFFGPDFGARVYERSPEESYERLFEHMRGLFPEASEKALRKFLG